LDLVIFFNFFTTFVSLSLLQSTILKNLV